jgi:tetratricopeptide (TPR) repeat protein
MPTGPGPRASHRLDGEVPGGRISLNDAWSYRFFTAGARLPVFFLTRFAVRSGVDDLARTFETTKGPLADRLLAALEAAQAAGGDSRGMQAAALLIFKPLGGAAGFSDRMIDLRVDDSRQPLVELRRLLAIYWSGQLITDGNSRITAGDLDGGLKILVAARDKSPENDNAWVALATAYLKMNRRTDALAALTKAIALNPAVKRQAVRNMNFAVLRDDVDFRRLLER